MRPIDADALMKDVLFRCNQEIVKYKTMRHALGNVGRAAFDAVKAAPTIDAEPVQHGRWRMKLSDCYWPGDVICSECNKEYNFFSKPNYCPNCGANMRGDSDG